MTLTRIQATRRSFLRSATACIALPLLESLGALPGQNATPKRAVWLGFSFGVAPTWFPQAGPLRAESLGSALPLLEQHLDNISIVRDLYVGKPSDSHYGTTTFLTCADIFGTPGKAFANAVSCDQIAAETLGTDVRNASLTVSSPRSCVPASGGWGPGLSLSWSRRGNPVPAWTRPIDIYHQLFGGGDSTAEDRIRELGRSQSVLDSLRTQIQGVRRKLTADDRVKLEQYVDSIREIELQLVKEREWVDVPHQQPVGSPPEGNPQAGSSKELDLMYTMMALALQVDETRVITYRQASEGILREIGYRSHGHGLNHGQGDPQHTLASARDRAQMTCFARFLDRLESIQEADGRSLLHHSLVTYGSGIRTVHDLRDLPILIAGRAGGAIRQGQHVRYPKRAKLASLWRTQLRALGCDTAGFHDHEPLLGELLA
jgi:hypothetical protein